MAYQVYFAELSEENKALTMTLLRFKEEAGTIEPRRGNAAGGAARQPHSLAPDDGRR